MGLIVGIDEVGRGAWAGPITVCAFVAEEDWTMEGLKDSKKLSWTKRREMGDSLRHYCKGQFSVVDRSAPVIDRDGLDNAWAQAIHEALQDLEKNDIPLGKCRIVIDGNVKPFRTCEAIPKADNKFPTVMAASILAKTHRDAFMVSRNGIFVPRKFCFDTNVGYGTDDHLKALRTFGPTDYHRRSFAPVKKAARDGALRKHLLGPAPTL